MPNIRVSRIRFRFSLKMLLLLFVPVAARAMLVMWMLNPPPLEVRVAIEPYSLLRYDDHAGHLVLGAVVRITNVSKSTTWFLGLPGAPVYNVQQLIDGNWETSVSSVNMEFSDSPVSTVWTQIHPMESVTIVAGPISEKTTEIRVGVPFTTERFAPTKAHWVFSPTAKIVKKEELYFPEPKSGAQQEEQILPLNWPDAF